MGLFGGGKPKSAGPTYVRVRFANLVEDPSPDGQWYLYRWNLPGKPKFGDRVIVDPFGGAAVVIGEGKRSDYRGSIADLERLPTKADYAAARKESAKREKARAAGIKQQRSSQGKSTGASRAPEGLVGGLIGRLGPGSVRGRYYGDWVETINELKRVGRHEEVLTLLAECQDATLRADVGHPAPWYFEQAAIIYRKEKRYTDEVAMLQRYFGAVTEQTAHPKMVERWNKLQALLAKQAAKDGV